MSVKSALRELSLRETKRTLDRWYRALSEPAEGEVQQDKVQRRVAEVVEPLYDERFPFEDSCPAIHRKPQTQE